MSYRDPAQSISGPAEKISEGMEEFRKASMNRIRSGDWDSEHMNELSELMSDLTAIQVRLEILASNNW